MVYVLGRLRLDRAFGRVQRADLANFPYLLFGQGGKSELIILICCFQIAFLYLALPQVRGAHTLYHLVVEPAIAFISSKIQ